MGFILNARCFVSVSPNDELFFMAAKCIQKFSIFQTYSPISLSFRSIGGWSVATSSLLPP